MFPENIEVTQGEPFDPVIESTSLEMRQQELDGRYIHITTEKNPINVLHSWTLNSPLMFAL